MTEQDWISFTTECFMFLSSNQRYALKKLPAVKSHDEHNLSLSKVHAACQFHGYIHQLQIDLRKRTVTYRKRTLSTGFKKFTIDEILEDVVGMLKLSIESLYASRH